MNNESITPQPGRRDAAKNRERILAVARQLFAVQGVDATSMNQIAQEAQVGAGTLYRHFAHKGELCSALLADDIAAFQQRAAAIADGPTAAESALTRLEQLLNALVRMIESHIPLLTAMQESAPGGKRNDVFQTPFYRSLHGHIVHVLQLAIEQGEMNVVDVVFTADAIFGVIAPPLFAFQRQERGFSRDRIVAGVRRLFIDGLRAGSANT